MGTPRCDHNIQGVWSAVATHWKVTGDLARADWLRGGSRKRRALKKSGGRSTKIYRNFTLKAY